MTMLSAAWEITHEAHDGQTDKSGVAYATHPARVGAIALRLMTVDYPALMQEVADDGFDPSSVLVVAWLHDVIEDTSWSLSDLKARGISDRDCDVVEFLTRDKDAESYQRYIARIASSPLPLPLIVKRADLEDNMDPHRLSLLEDDERERLQQRYLPALGTVESALMRFRLQP